MVRTRRPTIDRAMVNIDEELDLIRTERDAFEAFLARLRELDVGGWDAVKTGGGHRALTTVESSPSTEFREIRQAYRETVMGVSHYDQEYGDTLRESLTAELGNPLAEYSLMDKFSRPLFMVPWLRRQNGRETTVTSFSVSFTENVIRSLRLQAN